MPTFKIVVGEVVEEELTQGEIDLYSEFLDEGGAIGTALAQRLGVENKSGAEVLQVHDEEGNVVYQQKFILVEGEMVAVREK